MSEKFSEKLRPPTGIEIVSYTKPSYSLTCYYQFRHRGAFLSINRKWYQRDGFCQQKSANENQGAQYWQMYEVNLQKNIELEKELKPSLNRINYEHCSIVLKCL